MLMIRNNSFKEKINEIPVPREKLKEVLRIEALSKVYHQKTHDVTALKNINCTIHKGEMVAIMGTSGSGKSTLLNMISAIDEPTNGQLYLSGKRAKDIYKEPYASTYRKENIGFIFQSFQLLKDLSVEDNIALPLILNDVPQAEIAKKVKWMMEKLGISDWRKHRPIELSGGQQQRVAIARAIITNPPILLADEPTGALDFNTTKEIMQLLIRLKEEKDQSILLVTHDPYVATYANRILFFHDGEIVDEYIMTQTDSDLDQILAKFKLITRGEA